MSVTVVTVTYGKRAHLLTQVLDAARTQGVAEAVVIDNGSSDPVAEILSKRYGDWAFVHSMGGNKGSAPGFKAGIEQALARGAEFLLLLDDDNLLGPRCLQTLFDVLGPKSAQLGRDKTAVFGCRQTHQGELVRRSATKTPLRVNGTFRGFHVFDIPRKIATRLAGSGHPAPTCMPPIVPVVAGPYGGMLFHRTLTDLVGLPNPDFLLYDDDTDFTHRVIRQGGALYIVVAAEIIDLEYSWNAIDQRRSNFATWLEGDSDFRAFYAFRNGVYHDIYCREGARAALFINMIVFMSILTMLAVFKRRGKRMTLLWLALNAGLFRRLGVYKAYPL